MPIIINVDDTPSITATPSANTSATVVVTEDRGAGGGIKVNVGASQQIRSVPLQETTRPIIAAGEKKPVILPDSVVLGIDTIGDYVATIDAGVGIIIFPETNSESANIVICHANTSSELSTNNDILAFPQNISIDQFGHITEFDNISLDVNNFVSDGTIITARDIVFGNTAVTIGDSTDRIEGLEYFSVGNLQFANNFIFSDSDINIVIDGANNSLNLTNHRITNVGSPFELSDAINLEYFNSNVGALDAQITEIIDYVNDVQFDMLNRLIVLAASTQNINTFVNDTLVLTPGSILDIDGVNSWQIGDGLLVKDQTIASQNGRYELTQSGSSSINWIFSRSIFNNDTSEIAGQSVFVTDGTVNGKTGWVATVDDSETFVINVGDIDYSQYQGVGTFTAGRGLTLTDTEFNVDYNQTLEQINSLSDNLIISSNVLNVNGSGALIIPIGTSLERPTAQSGMIRYNTEDNRFEAYDGSFWTGLGGVTDADQNTFIRAETIAGADNNQLEFFTSGTKRMELSANGDLLFGVNLNQFTIDYDTGTVNVNGDLVLNGVLTSANGDLILAPSNNVLSVSNSVITDVLDPIQDSDGVNKNYLENIFSRSLDVVEGANTYSLSLLSGDPRLILDTTLNADFANNALTIGLSDIGVTPGLYGNDGYVPRIQVTKEGLINFVTEIPLELTANAIPDFTETTRDIIGEMFRFNTEEGVQIIHDDFGNIFNVFANNFDIELDGDITGTGFVNRLTNTVINTSITGGYISNITAGVGIDVVGTQGPNSTFSIAHSDTSNVANTNNSGSFVLNNLTFDNFGHVQTVAATNLDNRYLLLVGGTLSGDIRAPRFVDSNDNSYYVDPAGTSRINSLYVGFGGSTSQIQMQDSAGSSSYIFASTSRIGFLNSSFGYASYSERDTGNWVVAGGSVQAGSFVDYNDTAFFINPAAIDSRLSGLNIDNSILIGSSLQLGLNTVTSLSGNLTLSANSNIISVDNSIITQVAPAVNGSDAINLDLLNAETANTVNYIDQEIVSVTNYVDTSIANTIATFTGGEGLAYDANTQTFGVNVDDVTVEIFNDVVRVKDSGITNAKILNSYIQIAADTGTNDTINLGETISFSGNQGISTLVSNNEIVIEGIIASNTNIGVSYFSPDNFNVTAQGEVTITTLDGGVF